MLLVVKKKINCNQAWMMQKLVSLFVLFCIQFVLWANLAVAMNYIPSDLTETVTEIHKEQFSFNRPLVLDSMTKVGVADQLFYDTAIEAFSAADSGIDLCLPAVIISKSILSSARLSVFNDHRPFSTITWHQVKSPRPPNS